MWSISAYSRRTALIRENNPSASNGWYHCYGVRKITKRANWIILRKALWNRQSSATELLDKLEMYNINISIITLRCRNQMWKTNH